MKLPKSISDNDFVYLDTAGGVLHSVKLEFCPCGQMSKFHPERDGWMFCPHCGMDQRKLPKEYKRGMMLWIDGDVTADGRLFQKQRGILELPAITVPQEILDRTFGKREKPGEIKILKREDLIPITPKLDGVFAEKGGTRGEQPTHDLLTPMDPDFRVHIASVERDVVAEFNYPRHMEQEMKDLFLKYNRVLPIAPLADPKPNTKTAKGECSPRGGPGGLVRFPVPKNIKLLEAYPKAWEQITKDPQRRNVSFSDYKLALQLHFECNLALRGKPYTD